MNYRLFPSASLIGQGWPMRSNVLATTVQKAYTGREVRIANYRQARYKWSIPFGYLNSDPTLATGLPPATAAAADLQILMGFHEEMFGNLQSFTFEDRADKDTRLNSNNNLSQYAGPLPAGATFIADGDGTSATYQLSRTMGDASHAIYQYNIAARAPQIWWWSGSAWNLLSTEYTLGTPQSANPGLITMVNGVLPAGQALAADFAYYFLVRFDDDELEAENVAGSFWTVKKVDLIETYS
jgi:uncharacterized protein (TIGR02217 family)